MRMATNSVGMLVRILSLLHFLLISTQHMNFLLPLANRLALKEMTDLVLDQQTFKRLNITSTLGMVHGSAFIAFKVVSHL